MGPEGAAFLVSAQDQHGNLASARVDRCLESGRAGSQDYDIESFFAHVIPPMVGSNPKTDP
jgi:hypothetical protein